MANNDVVTGDLNYADRLWKAADCACRKSHFSRDGDRTQLPKAIRVEIIRGHCGFGGQ
jgi:hypothetical protein